MSIVLPIVDCIYLFKIAFNSAATNVQQNSYKEYIDRLEVVNACNSATLPLHVFIYTPANPSRIC